MGVRMHAHTTHAPTPESLSLGQVRRGIRSEWGVRVECQITQGRSAYAATKRRSSRKRDANGSDNAGCCHSRLEKGGEEKNFDPPMTRVAAHALLGSPLMLIF